MSEKFSIETFIDNRWAEARIELVDIAPKFVHSLEAYDGLIKHGFFLPEGLPKPEKRLPFTWYELLESTLDVTQAVERLDITLEMLGGNSERRLARYYYTVWLESAYALCEKIESLVAHTCKLHSINRRAKRRYHAQIKSEVRNEIDKRRTAFVHGANRPDGGIAITATAITDDCLWEHGVFNGPRIIKIAITETDKSGKLSAQDYFSILKESTNAVLDRLGSVLEKVEQDIGNN